MPLQEWLADSAGEEVISWAERIHPEELERLNPDFLVSYNYRYILKEQILNRFPVHRAINLHISYLPWNRGSDPNFWSFFDRTPNGVTIHLLDPGVDTGPVLLQKRVDFDRDRETLSSSYQRLHSEIQTLFIENWDRIRTGSLPPRPQSPGGSLHLSREFKRVKDKIGEKIWEMPIPQLIELSRGLIDD